MPVASYLPMTSSVRLLLVVWTQAAIVKLSRNWRPGLSGTITTLVLPLKLRAWLVCPATGVASVRMPLRRLPERSITVAPERSAVSKDQEPAAPVGVVLGLEAGGLTVTVARADFVESAWLVAVTVTVCGVETVGAV